MLCVADNDDDRLAQPAVVRAVDQAVAARPGPIVGVHVMVEDTHDWPRERLVIERTLSVDTAAAGGNASLRTMA